MRETATYIRCDGDGCKTIAKVASEAETPTGWFRVWEAKESSVALSKNGTHAFDLCSLRCVERWAKARRLFLKDSQPSGVNSSINRTHEAILEALADGGALSIPDLATLTEFTASGIRTNLERMTRDGEVECVRPAVAGNSKLPALYKAAQVTAND